MATSTEQRRSKRRLYDLSVEIHHQDGAQKVHTVDISRQGFFVAAMRQMPLRYIAKVTLHLPSGSLGAVVQVTRSDSLGMGLQFFALSRDAKNLWNEFYANVSESVLSESTSAEAQSVFFVKLGTEESLQAFFRDHFLAGGTYLRTPVMPKIGSIVCVTVVHPRSNLEFPLLGKVVRHHQAQPTGIEIHFHPLRNPKRFERFVNEAIFIPETTPPEQKPADEELVLDIDISDFEDAPLAAHESFEWDAAGPALDPESWPLPFDFRDSAEALLPKANEPKPQ